MHSADAPDLSRAVGWAAIVFPSAYLVSDLLEVAVGGFSTLSLVLTYLSEAGLPFVVLGLCALQWPRVGRLGLNGAALFAYAYVFFTATVAYALVDGIRDYDEVARAFGWVMTLHGVLLVGGGVCFGHAVVRAGVLPPWTGRCLALGVVLVAVASGTSDAVRTVASAVPDAALIGMGVAVLRGAHHPRDIAFASSLAPTSGAPA